MGERRPLWPKSLHSALETCASRLFLPFFLREGEEGIGMCAAFSGSSPTTRVRRRGNRTPRLTRAARLSTSLSVSSLRCIPPRPPPITSCMHVHVRPPPAAPAPSRESKCNAYGIDPPFVFSSLSCSISYYVPVNLRPHSRSVTSKFTWNSCVPNRVRVLFGIQESYMIPQKFHIKPFISRGSDVNRMEC